MGLGHPRGDRTHTHFRHQFHMHARFRVGILEVVDQLRQVLDGIDIMVRRRRDQAHPGRGMAHLGDPRIDLGARQLPALARFRALRHLDLQVVGVHQVFAGHAETAGRHLLDGAAPQVAVLIRCVTGGVFAALAGIGLAADTVHGDSQGLVGFLADGTVGHGAGGEALHYVLDRFHFLQGYGLRCRFELHQPAQGGHIAALVIHQPGIFLENTVLPGTRGMLQPEHGFRVEQVVLAVAAPLVFAAPFQVRTFDRPVRERVVVAHAALFCNDIQPDTADARSGPGEVMIHEVLVQADGLEDLGAPVGLHR